MSTEDQITDAAPADAAPADAAPADPAPTDAAPADAGPTDPAPVDPAAQAEADAAAKSAGFANAENKAEAEGAAGGGKAKGGRGRKAKAKAVDIDALPPLADWIDAGHGELSIGMGDATGPSDAVPTVPLHGVTRQRGRFVTDGAVVPRTAKLTQAVSVTHAWLIDGDTPIARCELAAAITLHPNAQVEFKAGTLAFS